MALPASLQVRAAHSTSMLFPWQQVLSVTGTYAEKTIMAPPSPLQALRLIQSWLGAGRESTCIALPASVHILAALDTIVLPADKRDQAALSTFSAGPIGTAVPLAAQLPDTQRWITGKGHACTRVQGAPFINAAEPGANLALE